MQSSVSYVISHKSADSFHTFVQPTMSAGHVMSDSENPQAARSRRPISINVLVSIVYNESYLMFNMHLSPLDRSS